MRNLIVSEPGSDGVFRHVRDLIDFHLSKGSTIAYAYSSKRGSLELIELVERLKALRILTIDLNIGNSPTWSDLAAVWKLFCFAKEFQPDIIHCHSSKAGLIGRSLWFLGLDAQYYYTPHAYYQMGQDSSLILKPYWIAERFLALVGITINVGENENNFATEVLGIPQTKTCISTNWVDCNHFAPAGSERSKIHKIRFGTIARFAAQKDPLPLYRALKQLIAEIDEIEWIHVGSGPLVEEVMKIELAPMERIEYLKDCSVLLRTLDVFVLTSKFEGLPLSVLEALSTGLPLVLSDVPGLTEFKRYSPNAVFWCRSRDESDIFRALRAAFYWCKTSSKECNHRQIAERHFHIERRLKALFELLNCKPNFNDCV